MVDLWAEDIAVSTLRPPVVILREQAALLGQKTKNIITAEVKSSSSQAQDIVIHSFYIVAPSLDDYHYKLFSISHNSIKLYPVSFYLNNDMQFEIYGAISASDREIDSEKDFIALLERILKSKETKRVVQSLLTQSSDDFIKISQVVQKTSTPSDDEIPF